MKNWFYQPSTNIEVINSRHEFISILLDSANFEFVKDARKILRSMKNVPRLIENLQIGKGALDTWIGLITFIKGFQSLRSIISRFIDVDQTFLFQAFQTTFSDDILELHVSNIEGIINFDDSKIMNRVVVNRGVDENLDKYKETYEQIEGILADIAVEISETTPEISQPINVMYFPQLGYLIVFDIEYANETKSLMEDGRWESIFSTNTHLYFKSDQVREMDSQFGDIHAIICDQEIEIIQSLQEEILKDSSLYLAASHLCAQFDCHLAFAETARTRNYVRPNMTKERKLLIREGLHPIYEQAVDVFIANDVDFFENDNDKSIMLLTGANYSGKTVYLTQCALIVFMAHIGSFVPAREATIGITDRILARISNRETVSRVSMFFDI